MTALSFMITGNYTTNIPAPLVNATFITSGELTGISELTEEKWTQDMIDLLLEIKEKRRKRDPVKQGKARNMLNHLSQHRHEVLAFMEDYRVDFDNNQAERYLWMIKAKQS